MSLFPSNSTATPTPAQPSPNSHTHQAIERLLTAQLVADQQPPANTGAVSVDQEHDAVSPDQERDAASGEWMSWMGTVYSEASGFAFRCYKLGQILKLKAVRPLSPVERARESDDDHPGATGGAVTEFDELHGHQNVVTLPPDWQSDSDSDDPVQLWPATGIALDYADALSEGYSELLAYHSPSYLASITRTLHPDALGQAQGQAVGDTQPIPFSLDTSSDLLDSEGCVPAFLLGCTQEHGVGSNDGYPQ